MNLAICWMYYIFYCRNKVWTITDLIDFWWQFALSTYLFVLPLFSSETTLLYAAFMEFRAVPRKLWEGCGHFGLVEWNQNCKYPRKQRRCDQIITGDDNSAKQPRGSHYGWVMRGRQFFKFHAQFFKGTSHTRTWLNSLVLNRDPREIYNQIKMQWENKFIGK